METHDDVIVDISEAREKFFGCSGKMLIPGIGTVTRLIREIPAGSLLCTDQLRAELAARHGVQVTCPAATQKALGAIARSGQTDIPYWRIIKKNGELIARGVGDVQSRAVLLAKEGVTVDITGRMPHVSNYRAKLFRFDQTGVR